MGRRLSAVLTVGLLVYIAVALATGDGRPADRIDAIATGLRCPVCQSESVADSTSQTARDMRVLISEQVAAGRSDGEIEDFFVARYGDWILLDPPASGRTLLLWLLPLAGLLVGIAAVLGRRRGRDLRPEQGPAASEHRRHALQDVEEVGRQEHLGELDRATADRLRATYQAEARALEPRRQQAPSPHRGRSPWRVAAGLTILGVGIGVAGFAVVRAIEPRAPGDFATGGLADVASSGGDLDEVSNQELEAVVAANPDVIPMRLALARRYFNEGDFSEALPHYLSVLERENNPEALANVGWMAYLSDEPETASGYLEKSLEAAPDFTQAKWFLANVRLYGLEDPAGAAPLIEEVLAAEAVPDDIRGEAERMLAEASAGS